jgi:hypothetical protein
MEGKLAMESMVGFVFGFAPPLARPSHLPGPSKHNHSLHAAISKNMVFAKTYIL